MAAGIIAVYGLVVSVLIAGTLSPGEDYSLFAGFIHLGAGLACGMTGLAAGYAIGIVGDSVRRPAAVDAPRSDRCRKRLLLTLASPVDRIVRADVRLRVKGLCRHGPRPHLCVRPGLWSSSLGIALTVA
jgi:F0F1-type ATP synthase membrane subunit c/vacuolar-type H+-ATPase subunit K